MSNRGNKKRFGTRIQRTEILNVNVTRRVRVHEAVDGLIVHGLRLHRLLGQKHATHRHLSREWHAPTPPIRACKQSHATACYRQASAAAKRQGQRPYPKGTHMINSQSRPRTGSLPLRTCLLKGLLVQALRGRLGGLPTAVCLVDERLIRAHDTSVR
jgi:hypothetical protein